jgi:hypothetical protein
LYIVPRELSSSKVVNLILTTEGDLVRGRLVLLVTEVELTVVMLSVAEAAISCPEDNSLLVLLPKIRLLSESPNLEMIFSLALLNMDFLIEDSSCVGTSRSSKTVVTF